MEARPGILMVGHLFLPDNFRSWGRMLSCDRGMPQEMLEPPYVYSPGRQCVSGGGGGQVDMDGERQPSSPDRWRRFFAFRDWRAPRLSRASLQRGYSLTSVLTP